jgi:hypothetical protein
MPSMLGKRCNTWQKFLDGTHTSSSNALIPSSSVCLRVLRPVLKLLGLDVIPPEKQKMRDKSRRALCRYTITAIQNLKDEDDEFLQGANWDAVLAYVDPSASNVVGGSRGGGGGLLDADGKALARGGDGSRAKDEADDQGPSEGPSDVQWAVDEEHREGYASDGGALHSGTGIWRQLLELLYSQGKVCCFLTTQEYWLLKCA